MIVNPYTITALVLDGVSLGLAAATAIRATQVLVKGRRGDSRETGEELSARERDIYLLFWLGSVLLILRGMAWPFFYLVLNSYIHEITGAMCIFGATKLLPNLTQFLEITKPVYFFLGLISILLFRLERFACRDGAVFSRQGRLVIGWLMLLCGLVGAVEVAASLGLWLKASPEFAVSCCTIISDIPTRFTVWIPATLFGPQYQMLLWYLYFGANIFVVMFGLYIYRSEQIKHMPKLSLGISGAAALFSGLITILAFIEIIGPNVMGLAFHHCIYCLVQLVPDAPLFLGLLIIGTFCLMSGLPVWWLAESWAEKELLEKSVTTLLFYGIIAISGSLLMVTVHLLI